MSILDDSVGEKENELAPFTTLYIPSFVEEYKRFEVHPPSKSTVDVLSKLNWLTDDLLNEIEQCSPKNTDIDRNNDNSRCKEAFSKACDRLFPKGRMFASHKQLDQVVSKFAEAWAFKTTHSGWAVQCHYAKRNYKYTPNVNSGRKNYESLKDSIQCPFAIHYKLTDFHQKRTTADLLKDFKKLPKIYSEVRITTVNSCHTCTLDTKYHRCAIQKSGQFQLDVTKMNHVVNEIRRTPMIAPSELQEMLEDFVPSHLLQNPRFISNFRNRVTNYILNNSDSNVITRQQSNALVDSKSCAADEIILTDSTAHRLNFKNLLLSTIQGNKGDFWDVRKYMEDIKRNNPGFDYHVKLSETCQRPIGVFWMFNEMREELLRYSKIIYLDACKRNYNKAGWPYQAVVVMNNENEVVPVCEGLIVAESIDAYVTSLRACKLMEPRLKLSDISLIFADQFISEDVLSMLGISNTCVLHGDRYHLLNKVFPEKFKDRWDHIKYDVGEMLDASTQDVWDERYAAASEKLVTDPQLHQNLSDIYSDPKYYSQWMLRQVCILSFLPILRHHAIWIF